MSTSPSILFLLPFFSITAYRSAGAAVVLVLEYGKLRRTVRTFAHILRPLHVRRRPAAYLTVQRPQEITHRRQAAANTATRGLFVDAKRGLSRVEAFDGDEEGLEPFLLFATRGRVQLHRLVVVANVEGVGGNEVVAFEHL